MFTPGRPITVPAGYILVAAALVVGLLIGAYIIGYRNAENVMQSQFDESWLEAARTNEQFADMTDPLGGNANRGGTSREPTDTTVNSARPDSSMNRPASVPPPSDSLGPIDQPPLRDGTYHFVLATTRIDGAIRLAEFCRDQQLDAYVVTSKMSNRQKVIVFPALTSGSNSSAEAVSLKQKIERVGRKWKSEQGGASNFSDAYIEPVSRLQ